MPTAREALLDAAASTLAVLPWPEMRMGRIAASAGFSRQTLYNEFGGKDGLGRALIGRAADRYLAGVDEAVGTHAATGRGPVELALWTVRAARADVLVRALLTGFWDARLPRPGPPGPTGGTEPEGADGPLEHRPAPRQAPPAPAELLALARDRAVAVLRGAGPSRDDTGLESRCEIALRIGLSYAVAPAVTAPSPVGSDAVRLVHEALARDPGC
ncbi:TetR/AcrR family transcriptional regulator [Streptomyces halstedii]|uniref:TetR/AcrR family transcriptional regulator n=1 Tax=Streptomyces halstedii TaxID=1944 RepID=A0A6N9TZA9_STRHA|nr:TetR/AcrR family transcriptional regulator [Streptomyces halstedii]NEA16874.1 TetR/AcrR family transcriptional regulator [Streptomyces halstedii]